MIRLCFWGQSVFEWQNAEKHHFATIAAAFGDGDALPALVREDLRPALAAAATAAATASEEACDTEGEVGDDERDQLKAWDDVGVTKRPRIATAELSSEVSVALICEKEHEGATANAGMCRFSGAAKPAVKRARASKGRRRIVVESL
eukprot:SAG11_NODE_9008_length_954_cov_1.029240_1_plen_147_part_00